MKTYEFDVILKDQSEISDGLADALFAAGCDDGTPVSCNGIVWIHFDRDAASLEEAVRSAVAQVQSAGLTVSKVELEVDNLAVKAELLKNNAEFMAFLDQLSKEPAVISLQDLRKELAV